MSYEVRDGVLWTVGGEVLVKHGPIVEAVADALDVLIAAGWEYRPRTLTNTVQPVVYGPCGRWMDTNGRARG